MNKSRDKINNPRKTKDWADEEDDETAELDKEKETIEQLADGSELVTTTVYTLNEEGQRVKKVTKVKRVSEVIKINKRVQERRKWKKFGECANVPFGSPEKGITEVSSEEIILELTLPGTMRQSASDAVPKPKSDTTLNLIRNFTQKAQKAEQRALDASNEALDASSEASSNNTSGSVTGNKYVPPHQRMSSSGRSRETFDSSYPSREKREEPTVHITGLSEDTKDADITELCSEFGPVKRVYLGKNKNGKAKGFAYVTYRYPQDAQTAIEKLDGYGFNYLIIHAEWAKPSNN